MRYIKIVLSARYCGTTVEIYYETDMTDKELNDYVEEAARTHAESYEYMVFGWDESAEDYAESEGITLEEALEEIDSYYEDALAESYWEEITKEEYEENKE